MSTKELMNCLEYIGGLDFRAVDLPASWEAMYVKLKQEKSIVTGQEMIIHGKLLPVIANLLPAISTCLLITLKLFLFWVNILLAYERVPRRERRRLT